MEDSATRQLVYDMKESMDGMTGILWQMLQTMKHMASRDAQVMASLERIEKLQSENGKSIAAVGQRVPVPQRTF